MKALKCRIKSLRDNKLANVVLGLFSPYRFGITEYFGYDVSIMKDHIRFLEVIANRDGEMGGLLPLWFDGAVCDFNELPKPEDKKAIEDVYNKCKYLESTGNYPVVKPKVTPVLLLASLNKKVKHFLNLKL